MSIVQRTRQLLTPQRVLQKASEIESGVKVLPWTVSIARTTEDFRSALKLRTSAYERHFSGLESTQDEHDFSPNAFVLMAHEKRSGALLGTMRVAFGTDETIEMLAFHPAPKLLSSVRIGEARRLSLKPSRYATLVKLSLWKSFWLSCAAHNVQTLLIAARPPMNDDYRMLLFEDGMPGGAWFSPAGLGSQHELLLLRTENLEERYRAHSIELHRYMFVIQHPDIFVIPGDAVNPLHGLARSEMTLEPAPDLDTPLDLCQGLRGAPT